MLSSEKKHDFKKYYKKKNRAFQVMVLGRNGYWNKSQVCGISITGYLLFSGHFMSGCFEAENYMTIKKYNKLKMYLKSSHNGKPEKVSDTTFQYSNLIN